MYQMGQQYGKALEDQLKQTLEIIKQFYASQGVDYRKIVEKSYLFRDRYAGSRFESFIAAMADGSGISTDDAWVLNGQETIGNLEAEVFTSQVVKIVEHIKHISKCIYCTTMYPAKDICKAPSIQLVSFDYVKFDQNKDEA